MNPARRPYRNLANRSAPFGLDFLVVHGKKAAAQADCAAALISEKCGQHDATLSIVIFSNHATGVDPFLYFMAFSKRFDGAVSNPHKNQTLWSHKPTDLLSTNSKYHFLHVCSSPDHRDVRNCFCYFCWSTHTVHQLWVFHKKIDSTILWQISFRFFLRPPH